MKKEKVESNFPSMTIKNGQVKINVVQPTDRASVAKPGPSAPPLPAKD